MVAESLTTIVQRLRVNVGHAYEKGSAVLSVTRLDGSPIVLNADLIESIEAVPDTMIALTTHRKITVRESVPQVVELVIAYQRTIRGPLAHRTGLAQGRGVLDACPDGEN